MKKVNAQSPFPDNNGVFISFYCAFNRFTFCSDDLVYGKSHIVMTPFEGDADNETVLGIGRQRMK
jgi:hypothetical protein